MAYRGWQSRACQGAVFFACSIVGLAILSTLAVFAGVGLAKVFGGSSGSVSPLAKSIEPANSHKQFSKVLYETDFLRDLNNGKVFRRLKKSANIDRQSFLEPIESPVPQVRSGSGSNGTYRTVCVRMCDGYYFPISAATTKSRFARDERACQSRCGSAARLFTYPTDGGSPETMTDVRGRDYASLATAFLYRTRYDASCKCRPHPWEPDSIKAHQLYATVAWQKKARQLARADARKARKRRRRSRRVVRVRSNRYLRELGASKRLEAGGSAAGAIASVPVGAPVPKRFDRRTKMSLGVKPKRISKPRPRARVRSRSRRWKKSVFGGSES